MKLSEELIYRGFIAETTIKNPTNLDSRPTKKFYWGADPSADSLTIGNLAALMMCACFVRHGYEPYLLVGGATGQIGDPKDNSLLFDKTTDFSKLTTFQLKRFANFLPTTAQGQDLVDVLVSTSLANSKKKAREFITSGAISVAGTKATKNFCISYPALIKKGRNSFAIVQ